MSHSPESQDASAAAQEEYVRQWIALEELIRQGESFSGKERHCAFLNTGDGRFTDVSGAASFDFPEDGRVLAETDWDQDGDLDVWVRSRNAPALRLLRNDMPRREGTLSLRLSGTGANRDAIGARVTVELEPASRRLIETVRAGEGFRGQSTKWVHFGLAGAGAIKSITVRWPDGTRESFSGVAAGGRFELAQGAGVARPLPWPQRRLKVAPGSLAAPEPSGIARVLVVSQPPAPRMTYTPLAAGSAPADVPSAPGKPMLVNLFATWCTPCAMELKELGSQRAALEAAGVDVLALSLDALRPGDEGSRSVDPAEFLASLGYAGAAGAASADLLERVQIVVQQVVDNRRALPVPTSLLLTPGGKVGVIYLGKVDSKTLLADAKLLTGPSSELWNHVTAFKGRWHMYPAASSAASIAHAMKQAGHADDAARQEAAALADQADSRNDAAMRLLEGGQPAQAEKLLREIVASVPDHAPALTNLGVCLLMRGADAEAEQVLSKAVSLDASSSVAQLRLGHALQTQGKRREAVPPLREAVRLNPKSKEAAIRLAWLLSIDSASDGPARREALALATRAQSLEGAPGARDLDILAAAEAANGQHAAAVATVKKAIALAKEKSPQMVPDMQSRLALYESGKPYVMTD